MMYKLLYIETKVKVKCSICKSIIPVDKITLCRHYYSGRKVIKIDWFCDYPCLNVKEVQEFEKERNK